jgi:hypothetical protein
LSFDFPFDETLGKPDQQQLLPFLAEETARFSRKLYKATWLMSTFGRTDIPVCLADEPMIVERGPRSLISNDK